MFSRDGSVDIDIVYPPLEDMIDKFKSTIDRFLWNIQSVIGLQLKIKPKAQKRDQNRVSLM
jgi:hypothetical protein